MGHLNECRGNGSELMVRKNSIRPRTGHESANSDLSGVHLHLRALSVVEFWLFLELHRQ